MRVGEVATACGVSVDTVRHYERLQVIPAATRNANGYREYDAEVVGRVRIVRRALQIGFTLDELARIFKQRAAGQPPCANVQAMAVRKLDELDERIREMESLRTSLAALVEQWSARLENTRPGEFARLLESLG